MPRASAVRLGVELHRDRALDYLEGRRNGDTTAGHEERLQLRFTYCSKPWDRESQLSSRGKYVIYARSACCAREVVDTFCIYV